MDDDKTQDNINEETDETGEPLEDSFSDEDEDNIEDANPGVEQLMQRRDLSPEDAQEVFRLMKTGLSEDDAVKKVEEEM